MLSGLLGGVLNGETGAGGVPGRRVWESPPFCVKLDGFNGIFGLSALFTGGGSERFLDLAAVTGLGLNRPSFVVEFLGDERNWWLLGEDPGVVDRDDVLGGKGDRDWDSRDAPAGPWEV